MNLRRTSLRATLDQLTQDFTEAVLRVVRHASPTELADVFGAPGGRKRELARRAASIGDTSAPPPAGPWAAAPARSTPQRRRSRATATAGHEPAPPALVAPVAVGPTAGPEKPETRRVERGRPAHAPGMGAPPPPERCWTVNVAGAEQQEMALGEILTAYRSGIVTEETLVWKDGMSDWRVIRDVPEIFNAATK